MQSLDVISANIWQILISLANLLILFLTLKKFLFKPVTKAMDSRINKINGQFEEAKKAEEDAEKCKEEWEQKLNTADKEAEDIIKSATDKAKRRGDNIVTDAQTRAEEIIRQAKTDAALEVKKAEAGIRQEIVDVSEKLTEKLLEREINENDHRQFIDSFISNIGEDNDGNK